MVKSKDYTLLELMAVAAAREIKDGEVVFTGTGLPMLGGMLAQHTHAINCVLIFQTGTVDPYLVFLLMEVFVPRVMRLASTAGGLIDVFSILQAGHVDVGFLGGAQVDIFGNINSTSMGDSHRPSVRFTGSGGACDIACLAMARINSNQRPGTESRKSQNATVAAEAGMAITAIIHINPITKTIPEGF